VKGGGGIAFLFIYMELPWDSVGSKPLPDDLASVW